MVHWFNQFLRWGGFPETIGKSPELHRTLLQDYVSSVIYRDIVDRYGISSSHALRQLLSHCLRNSATLFSVNKLYQNFKSMGYEIGKTSLYQYMSYFEDAYCVFSVSKFDLSLRKAAQSMKKIYTIDQGLTTAFSLASDFDLAPQLETAVFSYLRRQSSDLFYYHTREGKAVDFLLLQPDQTVHLFQVCLSLKNLDTRRREVEALQIAMKELNQKFSTIVTLDEEEEIEVPSGKIRCIPAWMLFLMELNQ